MNTAAAAWSSQDYNAFVQLCRDEALLCRGDDATELRNHCVYQWLAQHAPRAVAQIHGEQPSVRLERLQVIAKYMALPTLRSLAGMGILPADESIRVRKSFTRAQTQIRRLEETLRNDGHWGTVGFLHEPLARAAELLVYRPSNAEHPWIERLARELYQCTGAVDPRLLLELAAAFGLDLEERTAQRYAENAKSQDSR